MASKGIKKKKGEGSGGGAQQFLLWHGEKIVVGIVAVVALWFALQGLGYQTLPWQPNALEEDATAAEAAIRNSQRSAEEELKGTDIQIVDFAERATQIRSPIPTPPYRNLAIWHPDPPLSTQTRSQSSSSSGSGSGSDYSSSSY